MTDNMYDRLSEPFPQEMERTVQKSGTRLTYLPVSEIINRMNRIFGPTGWSHEVISCSRDAQEPEWVIAHVRVMTVENQSREKWTVNHHDGFGGVRIKRTKAGEIVDLGDEFKGAVSDALKKACQHLGVGLYLARDVEAIEVDEAMHAPAPQPVAPVANYQQFVEVRDMLDEAQRKILKEYWMSYSGGRPVPKPSEFTEKELKDLTAEALRIQFNAKTIANFDSTASTDDVEA